MKKVTLIIALAITLLSTSVQAIPFLGPTTNSIVKTGGKVALVAAIIAYGSASGYGPEWLQQLSDEYGGQVVKQAVDMLATCSKECCLELADLGGYLIGNGIAMVENALVNTRDMAVELGWYVFTGELFNDVVDGAYALTDRVTYLLRASTHRLRGSSV